MSPLSGPPSAWGPPEVLVQNQAKLSLCTASYSAPKSRGCGVRSPRKRAEDLAHRKQCCRHPPFPASSFPPADLNSLCSELEHQASPLGHVNRDDDFLSCLWFGGLIWVPTPLWLQLEEIVLEWGQWFLFCLLWWLLFFNLQWWSWCVGWCQGAEERMEIYGL